MKLSDDLEKLVLEGDYEGAKTEILREENRTIIENDGMQLIEKVFDVGLRTAFTPNQISACSEMLCHITRVMSGKEALISLLEQIEIVDLENKLHFVLEPLRITMDKLHSQWHKNLKWVLEVIGKRLRLIPVPSEIKKPKQRLRGDNVKKLESENGCIKTNIYDPVEGLLTFYDYCVAYCVTSFIDLESQAKFDSCTTVLREYVLQLLGHPLVYCPCEYLKGDRDITLRQPNVALKPIETKAVDIAIRAVELMGKLHGSVGYYHDWLEMKISDEEQPIFMEKLRSLNQIENSESEDCVVVDYVSVGYLFYLVYGKNLNEIHRNGPSSPVREVTTGLFLISQLLENENVEVQVKALSFGQSLLNQLCPMSPFHRLASEFLYTNIHSNFYNKLAHVIMYSDHHEIRRIGACVFKSYLWAFNSSGRFDFIKYILSSECPDTLIGFVITQLKEFARQALEKIDGFTTLKWMGHVEPLIPGIEIYFTGMYLQSLLKLCMKVKSGPMIDLMSCDSQVLSTLNLIRFLLIRDGKTNHSGVVSFLYDMIQDFLKLVRKSLDLTVMQTKGRINELKDPRTLEWESKQLNNNTCDTVVNDFKGGALKNPLELTAEEQIQSCKKLLSKMDLLECILGHTNECFDSSARMYSTTNISS